MLHLIMYYQNLKNTYNWSENTGIDAFCEHFASIQRSLIIKEKIIALYTDKYDKFDDKWKVFIDIYDYRGPDMPLIYSQLYKYVYYKMQSVIYHAYYKMQLVPFSAGAAGIRDALSHFRGGSGEECPGCLGHLAISHLTLAPLHSVRPLAML